MAQRGSSTSLLGQRGTGTAGMPFVTCGFISIMIGLWMLGELGLAHQKACQKACHTPTHSHNAVHCLQHPHLTLQLLPTLLTLFNLMLSLMHCLPCSSE